jgi:transcription elongation factor
MTRREPKETVCRMRSLNQGTDGNTSCVERGGEEVDAWDKMAENIGQNDGRGLEKGEAGEGAEKNIGRATSFI